jgi:hypothetical protein
MAQLNAKILNSPKRSEKVTYFNIIAISVTENYASSYHVWTPALLVTSLVFWYEVRSDIVAGICRTSFFFSHAHGTITF